MSDACAVSVIVPVCNVERYLRECLESLAAQTLEDIQVICVDDGSTDSSLSILREFEKRDPRFEVITKPNAGYGHTMNMGLDCAKGEYVGILESDDFAETDMFESLYEMAKGADVDVVKTDFFYHVTDSDPKFDDLACNMVDCYCDEPFNPLDHQEMFLMQPAIWSGLYRRSFLLEKGIRFLETPGASFQDTSFNYKAFASAEKALLSHDAFLHYRIDNANSSVKSQKKVFCICEEYEEMWRFTRSNPVLMDRLAGRLCFAQFGGYLWNLDRLSPVLQWSFYERFVEDFKRLHSEGLLASEFFSEEAWDKLRGMLGDADGFFAAHYGPKEVEKTFVLSVGAMGAPSVVRSAQAILSAMGPKDELLYVSSALNLNAKSELAKIREADARFFYEEVVSSCSSMALESASIRGNELIVVDVAKSPISSDLDNLTAALTGGLSGNAHGRSWVASAFSFSIKSQPSIPLVAPLLARWNDGGIDAPINFAFSAEEGNLQGYRSLLSVVRELFVWFNDLKGKDPSASGAAFSNVLVPLWPVVHESYEALNYDERLKLAAGETPDCLSSEVVVSNLAEVPDGRAPQISVLIPVYNAAKYLDECMASVLGQKGVTFEIVCVDDGSTDSSLSLLRGYQENNECIRVVSKLNGGAASARNVAMSLAKGEYLAFIDPDDYFASDDSLAKLYSAAKENKAMVCGGSFSCVNMDGSFEEDFYGDASAYSVKKEGFKLFEEDAFDYGWIRYIYNREFMESNNLVFPALRWYEDPVFFVDVMKKAQRYYLIPEVVYRYRVGYKTTKWAPSRVRDLLKGIGHNLDYAKETGNSTLYTRLVCRIDKDYLEAIESNLNDEEAFAELVSLQASLDPSLIQFVQTHDRVHHMLVPLWHIVTGENNTAIVRAAKKAESTLLYRSLQHVREKFN